MKKKGLDVLRTAQVLQAVEWLDERIGWAREHSVRNTDGNWSFDPRMKVYETLQKQLVANNPEVAIIREALAGKELVATDDT